jgi:hypothetical protein
MELRRQMSKIGQELRSQRAELRVAKDFMNPVQRKTGTFLFASR